MNNPRLQFWGDSIQGRRKNNEDSYLCKQINENSYVFAVADGMGGTEFGEVASQLVIQDVDLYISSMFSDPDNIPPLKEAVQKCIDYVQQRFIEYLEENPQHEGMGTTLILLLFHNNCYAWGNIGDSRFYRFKNNLTELLTNDHTLVQKIVEEGVQTDQELISRYAHLLTKCINGRNDRADIFPMEKDYEILTQNTGFILCTDGMIMENVDSNFNNKIKQYFHEVLPLNETVSKLITYASDLGSMDNITVLVLKYVSNLTPVKKKTRSNRTIWFIPLFITAIVGLLCLMKAYTNEQSEPATIFDTVSHVNDTLTWISLDSSDSYTKKPSSFISWYEYPDQKLLAQYHLVLQDTNSHIIFEKFLEKSCNAIPIRDIKCIRFPERYFLRIDAIDKNNSVITGNTIQLITSDKQNGH
jgi:PPM family protein phosphatase